MDPKNAVVVAGASNTALGTALAAAGITSENVVAAQGPTILGQFRFRSEAPVISRAALRGIASSINFSLINLVAQHLRSKAFGQVVDQTDDHYGHNLDQRNEIDADVAGAVELQQRREEQGFAVGLAPLDLAARLKVIRDSVAQELDKNAGLRLNPLTNLKFKNEFDIASPISNSLAWLTSQPARIDEAVVRNTSLVVGMDEASVRVLLEKQHQTQVKFLQDNAGEIQGIIDSLEYIGADGHAFGIDEDETVETRLPSLNRARLFMAADNGLWTARNREVASFIRGNPNALANIGMIDKERELLSFKFDRLLKVEAIKLDIDDAVSRGARKPTLKPLYKSDMLKVAA
jgi:hypothetical protein